MTTTAARSVATLALGLALPLASAPAWAAVSEPTVPTTSPTVTARAGTGALLYRGLAAKTVLTSSTGKKLVLTVNAVRSSSGTDVNIGVARGRETHLWSYKARAQDLAMTSTGAGTLTLSAAQTGNRGRLSLSFRPVEAAKSRSCGGKVATRTRKVAVSGIAYVKTGSPSWGTLGRATRPITLAGRNDVRWAYDVTCPSTLPPCAAALSWTVWTASGSQGITGRASGGTASATAYRVVPLGSPSGARRTDLVTLASVPVPTFTGDASAARVTAYAGGGSAALDGAGGFETSTPCRTGTTTGTQHDTQWFGSTTNGVPALRVPAEAFGSFTVADGATATFTRSTL